VRNPRVATVTMAKGAEEWSCVKGFFLKIKKIEVEIIRKANPAKIL
jgi:hypothetical protein